MDNNAIDNRTPYTPTAADIKAVASAAEDMYHHMVSVYKLCSLEFPADFQFEENFVAIRAVAQLCAQRLDASVTKLTGSETGYYADEFGL